MARTTDRATGNSKYVGASHIFDDAVMIANSLLRNKLNSGGEKIRGFADAARQFSGSLSDMPNLQEYTTMASDQLDNISGYVAETNLNDMLHDASAFARRRPVVTLGLAIAAGYLLTRTIAPQSMQAFSTPRPTKRGTSRKTTAAKTVRKAGATSAKRKKSNA